MLRRRFDRPVATATLLFTVVFAPSATASEPSQPLREERAAENTGEWKASRDAFHFGPLVGIGFPRPLAVGALLKIEGILAVGAEYSFLPGMNFAGVETSFKAMALD